MPKQSRLLLFGLVMVLALSCNLPTQGTSQNTSIPAPALIQQAPTSDDQSSFDDATPIMEPTPGPTAAGEIINAHEFIKPLLPAIFERMGYSMNRPNPPAYHLIDDSEIACGVYEEDVSSVLTYLSINIRFLYSSDSNLSSLQDGGWINGAGFYVLDRQSYSYRNMPMQFVIFKGGDDPENLGKSAFIKIDERMWYGFVATQTCADSKGDLLPEPTAMLDALLGVMEDNGWIFP